MSDQIAVFNEGRIEQVAPPAELYEHPATEFVAGFVGTSNIVELDGQRFSIRPEKIRIVPPDAAPSPGLRSMSGRIAEVVYLGVITRYVVDLDDGGRLVAVRQNLESTSQQALDEAGRRVRLEWRPEQTFTIEPE